MDTLLRRLREAGLSPELTHHAYHALDSNVVGSALWLTRISPRKELDVLPRGVLRQNPADIRQHLSGRSCSMKFFEFGLDLILDGIERLRATPVATAAAPASSRRTRRSCPV